MALAFYFAFEISKQDTFRASIIMASILLFMMISSFLLYRQWQKRLEEKSGTKKADDKKEESDARESESSFESFKDEHDLYLLIHVLVGNLLFFGLYWVGWDCENFGFKEHLCKCGAFSAEYNPFLDVLAYTIRIGDSLGIGDISPISPKFKALTLGQLIFNLFDIGLIVLSFGARGNFLVGKPSPTSPDDNRGRDSGQGGTVEKETKGEEGKEKVTATPLTLLREAIDFLEDQEENKEIARIDSLLNKLKSLPIENKRDSQRAILEELKKLKDGPYYKPIKEQIDLLIEIIEKIKNKYTEPY